METVSDLGKLLNLVVDDNGALALAAAMPSRMAAPWRPGNWYRALATRLRCATEIHKRHKGTIDVAAGEEFPEGVAGFGGLRPWYCPVAAALRWARLVYCEAGRVAQDRAGSLPLGDLDDLDPGAVELRRRVLNRHRGPATLPTATPAELARLEAGIVRVVRRAQAAAPKPAAAPGRRRGTKIATALVLLAQHPDWTDAEISVQAGVRRDTLQKNLRWKAARAAQRSSRGRPRRGWDARTGQTDLSE
jgi:hypothetical protein